MYNLKTRLLVDNPIDRYSIGDRTEGLKYGRDGGLTIYVQKESPGKDRETLAACTRRSDEHHLAHVRSGTPHPQRRVQVSRSYQGRVNGEEDSAVSFGQTRQRLVYRLK
jgi:hypothetical protein